MECKFMMEYFCLSTMPEVNRDEFVLGQLLTLGVGLSIVLIARLVMLAVSL